MRQKEEKEKKCEQELSSVQKSKNNTVKMAQESGFSSSSLLGNIGDSIFFVFFGMQLMDC